MSIGNLENYNVEEVQGLKKGAIIAVKNCIEKNWLMELTHVFYPSVEGSVVAVSYEEYGEWVYSWAQGPMFVTKMDGEKVIIHNHPEKFLPIPRPFEIVQKKIWFCTHTFHIKPQDFLSC
jgi:hypothetical protein